MAAKKSSAKKRSAKKKPSAKKTSAKQTTKKPSKKKGSKKPLVAKAQAESSPAACRECVLTVIERESGRTPGLDDQLSDLFVPCNPDVMARLKASLRECSDRDIQVQ